MTTNPQDTKLLKDGTRRVTVKLKPDEHILIIRDNAHYRLGYPVKDVVAAHIIAECVAVTWCSGEQEWVD